MVMTTWRCLLYKPLCRIKAFSVNIMLEGISLLQEPPVLGLGCTWHCITEDEGTKVATTKGFLMKNNQKLIQNQMGGGSQVLGKALTSEVPHRFTAGFLNVQDIYFTLCMSLSLRVKATSNTCLGSRL